MDTTTHQRNDATWQTQFFFFASWNRKTCNEKRSNNHLYGMKIIFSRKEEEEEEEETYLVVSLYMLHRDDAMFCVALLIVLLLHQFFVVLQVFVALQVIPCCSAASWSRLCRVALHRVALRRVAPRCISSISCTHLRESTSESKHIHRETDKHTDRELTSRCNNQQHSSYRLRRRTTATRIGERGWLLCLLLHFCCSLCQ